jgi:hypothetical protein
MGAGEDLRIGPAHGRRRRQAALFYRNLISHVIELGEIALIEIEIQKSIPMTPPQPHCPSWRHRPPADQPPAKHH